MMSEADSNQLSSSTEIFEESNRSTNSTIDMDPLSLQCSQENNSTEDFDGTYLPLNLLIYPFTKWIETYYQSAY